MPEATRPGAIITGATGTIGRALAREFARAGYFLGLGTRREGPAGTALFEELRAAGADSVVLAGDLSVSGEAARLTQEFLKAAPGKTIDVLINNAGGNKDQLFYYSGEADWRAALDANLLTAMAMSRAVLPEMLNRRKGSIVSISSISGITGLKGQTAYAAAKAGLHGFTRALAREVGRAGIRVNAVAAGAVESPATAALSAEQKRWLESAAALERFAKPEEIAAVAGFLAS